MAEGKCKLTGVTGKFVKAHIIPEALTRPAVKGAPLIQSGQGSRPIRRWTSWYDDEIVIREGEDILAKYDAAAIKELRRLKLVWSSWGPMTSLTVADHTPIPTTTYGIRKISGADTKNLRLFFLSMLWRAGVSHRDEFKEIVLTDGEISSLRRMAQEGEEGSPHYFPIMLTQLSTMGEVHNQAPIFQEKSVPEMGEFRGAKVPMFRFYVEGLIAHIHRTSGEEDSPGALALGAGDDLMVSTVTFENSWQRENLQLLIDEAYRDHPATMMKLVGPPMRI